jgi:hypothetical protein
MKDDTYQPLSKKDANPLRYACFQPEIRDHISKIDKDPQICEHINDLYDLIAYQLQTNSRLQSEIISAKHKQAWKHYDRPYDHYDIKNRKFFTEEELKARRC